MRKLLAFIFCLTVISASAQSSDPQLKERLDRYASLNRELNFKELMEYIHPSLFKLAPKDEMIKAFESGFNNEDIEMKIDTISMDKIGPLFTYEGSQYHKVDYYMGMTLRFKDASGFADSSFTQMMMMNLQNGFPGKKIELDMRNASFRIIGMDVLLAIKDPQQLWLFLGYDKSKSAIIANMIPQAVLDHFELK
jgi:hypothetical protein